jgi:uncharacterized membrane protein YqjE
MTPAGSKTAGEMVSDILGNVSELLRSEVDLARAEIAQGVRGAATALVGMAVSLALAMTGLNLFGVGLVALIVAPEHPIFRAAMLVAAGFFVLALVIFLAAKSRLRTVQFLPVRTAVNVQRDAAAVKEAYRDR